MAPDQARRAQLKMKNQRKKVVSSIKARISLKNSQDEVKLASVLYLYVWFEVWRPSNYGYQFGCCCLMYFFLNDWLYLWFFFWCLIVSALSWHVFFFIKWFIVHTFCWCLNLCTLSWFLFCWYSNKWVSVWETMRETQIHMSDDVWPWSGCTWFLFLHFVQDLKLCMCVWLGGCLRGRGRKNERDCWWQISNQENVCCK